MEQKFAHSLIEGVNPNYVNEKQNDDLDTAVSTLLSIMYSDSPKSEVRFRIKPNDGWKEDGSLYDFYSTFAYDSLVDKRRYPYHSSYDDEDIYRVSLAVSKDCTIDVKLDVLIDFYSKDQDRHSSKIHMNLYNQKLEFDLTTDARDIHKAAMIYCYAMEQLNKMSVEEAYDSRFHQIKLKIEKYLTDLSKGNENNLDLDSLLSKEEMDICISSAKAETLKRFLINKDIIPQENGKMKYPTSYEKLVEFVPTVAEKYQQVKDRVKAKQDKAKQRELIKNKKRELKLAKIEEKRQLKEKQEQKRKSVRETDFNITL